MKDEEVENCVFTSFVIYTITRGKTLKAIILSFFDKRKTIMYNHYTQIRVKEECHG